MVIYGKLLKKDLRLIPDEKLKRQKMWKIAYFIYKFNKFKRYKLLMIKIIYMTFEKKRYKLLIIKILYMRY